MMDIKNDPELELQIIVTGMHTSSEFGLTYKEIEADNFIIDYKIDILLSSDSSSSITKSIGLGLISFSDALEKLQPDIMLLLGDRFETLAAGVSGIVARLPIAHLHGGEVTEGVLDEAFRHSLSKMSWWHFVSHSKYKKRVSQLGENPKRIFNVGGLGVDSINKTNLLSKKELQKNISFKLSTKNILITYHPETLAHNSPKVHFNFILRALTEINKTYDLTLIFTCPNADTDGRIISKMIENFVSNHKKNSIYIKSMGRINYLSALKYVDAVVGNSSSGILEAPSFKIGTINIGDRQNGRIKAKSVIDCDYNLESIIRAFDKLYSTNFRGTLRNIKNPYDGGNTSKKIINILKNDKTPKTLFKKFYDK